MLRAWPARLIDRSAWARWPARAAATTDRMQCIEPTPDSPCCCAGQLKKTIIQQLLLASGYIRGVLLLAGSAPRQQAACGYRTPNPSTKNTLKTSSLIEAKGRNHQPYRCPQLQDVALRIFLCTEQSSSNIRESTTTRLRFQPRSSNQNVHASGFGARGWGASRD